MYIFICMSLYVYLYMYNFLGYFLFASFGAGDPHDIPSDLLPSAEVLHRAMGHRTAVE